MENKRIHFHQQTAALVAHDNKKPELLDWATHWQHKLQKLSIYSTGTTGSLLQKNLGLTIKCLESGPLGGDQQIGAKIVEKKINYLFFFWDPLSVHPHDTDIKALLRLAVLWNIPTACNLSTADLLMESVMIDQKNVFKQPDFSQYRARAIP